MVLIETTTVLVAKAEGMETEVIMVENVILPTLKTAFLVPRHPSTAMISLTVISKS
jgi:hypothetical protein